MALTLQVSDSNTSYDLNVKFDGTDEVPLVNLLAPPRPPLEDNGTGAFDAALVQYQPNDETDIAEGETEDYLLNDRHYTKSFSTTDEELKKFYIPLNFLTDQSEVTINPSTVSEELLHKKLTYWNGTQDVTVDLSEGSLVTISFSSDAVNRRPVLEVSQAEQQPSILPGDVNGSGVVDITDVQLIIDHILNGTQLEYSVADVNGSGVVDITDVQLIIDHILNGTPLE